MMVEMGPILPKIEYWLAPSSFMAYDIKKEGITVEKRAMSKLNIYLFRGNEHVNIDFRFYH